MCVKNESDNQDWELYGIQTEAEERIINKGKK